MTRTIIAALGLAALWLLMSGIYDNPLILIFGVISVILAVWVGKRMDSADDEQLDFSVGVFPTIKYFFWLLIEIAKSNWAVSKIILSGKSPEKQNLFWAPVSQESDMGQVVFANSITLTPGTITVETEGKHFLIHALEYGDSDMDDLAEMDRQVTSIETRISGAGK